MVIQPSFVFRKRRAIQGFSLVEMIASICIIGILASIGVMALASNYYQAVTYTHDQRNAQELAEVCSAAQAAGLNFVVAGDLEGTINNVMAGGTPSDGAFQGQLFALPHLTTEDVAGAEHYLALSGQSLVYHAARE